MRPTPVNAGSRGVRSNRFGAGILLPFTDYMEALSVPCLGGVTRGAVLEAIVEVASNFSDFFKEQSMADIELADPPFSQRTDTTTEDIVEAGATAADSSMGSRRQ